MLRKSLQVLVGAVLLALVAIVAFATLGLNPPDQTLDDAERHVAHQDFARAIGLLNLVERDVQADPARHERLLRLRAAAHARLRNTQPALDDVEQLLKIVTTGRDDLLLEQIRLLALGGDGEAARLAALRFLTDHPGHGRALELAGEACQLVYQRDLKELLARIDRDLPASDRPAAQALSWSYLYRPDGDPEVTAALAGLAALHARDPRLQTLWQASARDLQALRERVQQGLAFFRGSLEAEGEPVAAFRAFALSLDQARRVDDLLVACEIQRRRFTHKYVDEAGAAAAWALLREGQDPAVIATVDRWLPAGTVQDRIAAKELGAGTLDLLVARAFAAHRRQDRAALDRAWQDGAPLWQALKPAPFAASLSTAVVQLANQDWPNAESSLRWGTDLLRLQPVPIDRLDLLPPLAQAWLGLLRRRAAPEPELQAALGLWQGARPNALAPRLARAEVLLELGRQDAALAALEEARELAPEDEEVFGRYLAVLRARAETTGETGAALFASCLRLRTTAPQPTHPIGHLLCGEVALAQGQWTIARSCALQAIDAFPTARAPRLLDARISMAAGRYEEAARQTAQLLARMPPDAETLALAFAAHRAADADDREILAIALASSHSGPGGELQAALLRHAITAEPATAKTFVTAAVTAAEAPGELLALGARALALGGEATAAAELLDRVLVTPTPRPAALQAEATRALAAWLEAAADHTPNAELTPVLQRRLLALGAPTGPLRPWLDLAGELATTHPGAALALLLPALAAADPTTRTGADFTLAGELHARAGRWLQAEECWTAALGFADRSAAAEALTRLCLAQGRPDRGAQVYALVDTPADAALAMRFQQFERAAELVARQLLRDGADLLGHCAMALVGQAFLVDWKPAEGQLLQDRAELLSLVGQPALASFALPRLQALVAAEPQGVAHRLLLARVHADLGAGQRARALHQAIAAERQGQAVLYREIARAAAAPGYELTIALRDLVADATTSGQIAGSPLTLAFAMQELAKGFRDGGHPDLADQMLLTAWQQAPLARPLTADDLQLLAGTLPPVAAWTVLDQVLGGPWPVERAAVVDRLYDLARAAARTNPEWTERLFAAARRHLATDGPRGRIVHFLLDHSAQVAAAELPAEERVALCERHLALVASGGDDDHHLGDSLRVLVAERGPLATLATIDALRRQYPASLPLWLARAQLSAGSSRAQATIAELRAVLRHADAPALQLEMLTLAAETRTSAPEDAERLQALPGALRDGPGGRYAAALLALRAGRADQALAGLASAPPRRDGMHLVALALAALQGDTPDGPRQAQRALEQLQRDYPSSSLARNAGSFAIQLALP